MPFINTTSGRSFAAAEGQSILEAASSNGVQFSYSCRNGRCSSCKCKIVSGTSVLLTDELGLSEQEKSEGWALSCARTATSDLQIEVEDLADLLLPKAKTLACRIQSIDRLGTDVLRIYLRLPPAAGFLFLPGQYVEVIAPEGGLRRSYSLASAAVKENQLELHIRKIAMGALSEYWFSQAKPGDLLRLYGPLGTFVFRDLQGVDLVFLATGTGIAPVKAMLESLALSPMGHRPKSVSVYWGGRVREDIYLDLSSITTGCHYRPVLSRENDDWSGAKGHVQNALMADRSDFSNTVVYACGSDTMIHSAKNLLISKGLPERHFYSDAFVCSATG